MIAAHYQIDFSEHYLADYMATRGIGFLGWNTRYPRFRKQLHARPRPGRHRRRRALAARGAGRGNHCAAGQLRGWLADGGLPGTSGRPSCDAAGRHAARGRTHRPARPPTDMWPAPRTPAGPTSSPPGWMRRSSTKTIRLQPIPTWICSTRRTGRPTARTSSPATDRHRSPATTPSPTGRNANSNGFARPASPTARSPFCAHGPTRGWSTLRSSRPSGLPNMCYAGVPVKANRSAHGIAAASHAAQLAGHVEPAACADPRRTASGPHRLPRAGDQRRTGHRRVSVRRSAHLRRARQHRQDRSARSTPTTTSPRRARAARRPTRSPSGSRSGGAEGFAHAPLPGQAVDNCRRIATGGPRNVVNSPEYARSQPDRLLGKAIRHAHRSHS